MPCTSTWIGAMLPVMFAPLALTDQHLRLVLDGARELAPEHRHAYLVAVAEQLPTCAELNDAEVEVAIEIAVLMVAARAQEHDLERNRRASGAI